MIIRSVFILSCIREGNESMVQTSLKELQDLQYKLSCMWPDKRVSIELPGGKPRLVME